MSTALVLIDIQNDYFPGGNMEVSGSEEASLRAREVLDLFRKRTMPVIHVRHLSVRPGATFFLPGTRGAEIHETVRPLSTEALIEKNYPNSFRDTPLRGFLEKEGITRLVIAGMMTHMCVDATTRAAFDYGLDCTLVHDACATRQLTFAGATVPAPQVQSAFLAALSGIYAKVVSAGEFISETKIAKD
jgi:nicotinamidase-related amidase